MAEETGLAKRVPKLTLVDAASGQLTSANNALWYIQPLCVSGPLHFGDYAGLPSPAHHRPVRQWPLALHFEAQKPPRSPRRAMIQPLRQSTWGKGRSVPCCACR